MAGNGTGPTDAGPGILARAKQAAANAAVYLSNALLYPLSKLLPRDPGLWAFGAPGGRFEGNAKYLFLWATHRCRDTRCVWISDSRALVGTLRARGYPARHRWSPAGIAAAARAGTYFVNDNSSDVNFALSGGAAVFNLWHGVGLKNVNRGARVGFNAELFRRGSNPLVFIRNMRRFERPRWILATSQATASEFFARCFDVPPASAPALGYPRLDPMIDPSIRELALSFDSYHDFDAAARSFARVVLYAPTVRTADASLLAEALPDLDALSAALAAQDAVLLLKLHPRSMPQQSLALPDNVRLLSENLDIYPVLDRIDAIVTDYSSLFFDYVFFRTSGVVLYTFDFDTYVTRDRDLAWDYAEVTVGTRAHDFAALCRIIRSGEAFAPLDPAVLDRVRRQFWDGPPSASTAAERIVAFMGRSGSPVRAAAE
ncbi:MAG TPA: CDP-glycerol glycerophosphotransferase family protein [Sphingomonas sp.]|nr:CDP-glycerol glycerophosphotransferase family protein [Sphingomonas sp.]